VKLTEAQIQKTCSDFLALDGWRPLRTDPTSDKSRGKGFGECGMADHLFIRYTPKILLPKVLRQYADVLWVEFKKLDAKGKPTKPSARQIEWHRGERARGALTVIAGVDFPATISGFIEWYRASGLARKVAA
jgi:hypothetical protein